jgi:zinc finger HIT domain-containing protein 3
LTTFSKLETSIELQQLFSKYPSLRSQLRQIHKCTRPPEPDTEEQPTDSRSFGNKGRSRVDDRGNWSAEKGFGRGLSLLKRLRDGDNGDSEGLGEFSQLVHMVTPVEGMEEVISRP